MRILGVDPGLTQTGYGIISAVNTQVSLEDYGIIKPKPKDALPTRLVTIFNDLRELIEHWEPSVVAVEGIFYGKNIRSTLMLGHARGAALIAAAQSQIPIYEYSPRKVKQALTGNGNADKSQVQYMVKSILKLSDAPEPMDASDALAVSICHLQQFRQGDL